MTRQSIAIAMLLLAACGGSEKTDTSVYSLARNPISVRGWILDVKGAQHEQIADMEIARRTQLFQSTTVWVEGTEFASGGVAENGSFIVLDVPPQSATLGFNAPGAETAKVELANIPPNADVLIPAILLENGGSTVLDPKKIVVRVSGNVSKARPTGLMATVAGHRVPVLEVPVTEMMDRRDYPNVPGIRPVATVR